MLQEALMDKLIGDVSLGQKIQDRPDISVKGKFALDAIEKNPDVEGTLASDITEVTNAVTRAQNALNNVVALPSGASTASDAEIAAAKVGPKGEQYATLQEAISKQITDYKGLVVSNKKPASSSKVDAWINTSNNEDGDVEIPQVNDEEVSEHDTWSSFKINSELEEITKVTDNITETMGHYEKTIYIHEIIVNDGDDLYDAVSLMEEGTHVIINPGVYDISQYINANENGELHIKNDCWIEGRGSVTIICNKETCSSIPSVFTFDRGNGKLTGVHVECSNMRYVIHDDTCGTAVEPSLHEIYNCEFVYNGTPDSWTPRALCGGCGNNAVTIIKDCIVECACSARAIEFHSNYSVAGIESVQKIAKGKLIIENCYSATGDIHVYTSEGDDGSLKDTVILTGNCAKGGVSCDTIAFSPKMWNNVDISAQ